MTRRNTSSRRLSLESLEPRAMMTGNVTVAVTNGILTVIGDALSNDVQIRQLRQSYTGEWPGVKLEIAGQNSKGQNSTTINGQDSIVITGVKSGVNIDMGAATDGSRRNFLRVANID